MAGPGPLQTLCRARRASNAHYLGTDLAPSLRPDNAFEYPLQMPLGTGSGIFCETTALRVVQECATTNHYELEP